MSYFAYKNGVLHAEDISVADLAAEYGTPFYLYSANAIRENYKRFDSALKATGINYNIYYALKANSNQAVISLLKDCGSGADVVSVGEIKRALLAGIPASKIVFSGVGKSEAEIAYALNVGILQFNVESESELTLLNAIAQAKDKVVEIALRVNPDVGARTHEKISTGKSENKFGIPLIHALRVYKVAHDMSAIKPCAIAMHIGSQLMNLYPYKMAWRRMAKLAKELIDEGINIKRLDLGGGLGVAYGHKPAIPMDDYASLVTEIFGNLDVSFMFEPGRSLVGDAGILVSRIVHAKEMPQNTSMKSSSMKRHLMENRFRQRRLREYFLLEHSKPLSLYAPAREKQLEEQERRLEERRLREQQFMQRRLTERSFMERRFGERQARDLRFIICDAAMNDFIRPTLYEASHRIDSVVETDSKKTLCDVVGPICESGDYFAKRRRLPTSLNSGDLIYISDVGAYGAVMSGTYNTRPLIAEVMVQGNESALIRPAVNEDDIIAQDEIPSFL